MAQVAFQTDVSIMFPENTYYLKREWMDKNDLPGLSKSGMYYIARCEEGEMCAIFGSQRDAFVYAKNHQDFSTLLWAH